MKLQALRLPAKNGVLWLKDSLRLYRSNPIQLTAVTSAFLMLLFAFRLLPVVGQFILPLFLPMLTVIIGNACRAIDGGQLVRFTNLFAEIRAQRLPLMRLGSLQLLLTLLVLLLVHFLGIGDLPQIVPGTPPTDAQLQAMTRFLLLSTAISLPLAMAYWFAPFLAAWDAVPALKALFFSIVAVCRNWRAFLVYFLSACALGVFIPFLLIELPAMFFPAVGEALGTLLGLAQVFIFLPIVFAAGYVSYKDVFVIIGISEEQKHG